MEQDTMTAASQPLPARDEAIRAAQTAVIDRMRADLDAACSTIVTTGWIGEGLACEVVQGKHRATLDLGRGMGDAAGPSRASLPVPPSSAASASL